MRKLLLASSALLFMAPHAFAQDGSVRAWRMVPEGEAPAAGDCIVAEGGTTQFQPSGQNDAPQADTAGTPCPPGMVPANPVTQGSSDGTDGAAPSEGVDPDDSDDDGAATDGGATDDGSTDDDSSESAQ